MKRNRKLLLKAAKRIEKFPQSYDQATFCRATDRSPCGMAGCLGGEIIIAAAPTVREGIKALNRVMGISFRYGGGLDSKYWPGFVAATLAGFNNAEAERLFYNTGAEGWPFKFRSQFKRAKSHQGQARAAVRLLRYLADGGGV